MGKKKMLLMSTNKVTGFNVTKSPSALFCSDTLYNINMKPACIEKHHLLF